MNRPTGFPALLMLFFFASGPLSRAQQPAPAAGETAAIVREAEPLKGLTALKVIVEDLDQDATQCGLAADRLTLAATEPLVEGKLRVVQGQEPLPRYGIIYVNVTVLPVGADLCVSNLRTELATVTFGVELPWQQDPSAGGKIVLAKPGRFVPLLRVDELITGSRKTLGDQVETSVRPTVADFVSKIKLANAQR